MKRTVLFTLIIAFLCQFAVFGAAESFSSTQSEWTIDSGANKVRKPMGGAEDDCIRLTGNGQRGLWKTLKMSGIVTIESSVYADSGDTKIKAPSLRGINAAGEEAPLVQADVLGDALSATIFDGVRNTRLSIPFPLRQWNKITLQLDTQKDVFSLWLNGESVAANKRWMNGFDVQTLSMASFCSASIDGFGYVDDVNIYAGKAQGVKASAAIGAEDIIINENFNGAITGWNMDASIKQVNRDETDKFVEFQAGMANKYLSRSLGDITGVVTIEASVLIKDKTTQIKIPDIYVNGNVQGVLLSVVGESVSVPYFAGGKNTRATLPITLGEWFKITTQCSTITDTFSVWVDGKLLLDNVAFYNGVDAQTISTIRFNANNATDPSFCVDNVRAYKGEAQLETETTAQAEPLLTDYLSHMVVLKKDSRVAYQTNYRTEIAAAPYVNGNQIMIPLHVAAKGFLADSGLDSITKTQYISYHGTNVKISENDAEFIKNGVNTKLVTPAVIKDGEMYVSVMDIQNILEKEAVYDALTGIVLMARTGKMPEEEKRRTLLPQIEQLYLEQPLPEAQLYVSPDSKNGNGTIERPFATIEDAKNAVAALIQKGKTGNITVFLREGTYYATQAIRFTQQDSHSGNYTVTYKAYENERALIDGGKRITDWKPYKNGIYMAEVGKGFDPQTLYEDGSRVTIARYPNTGYNRVIMSQLTPKRRFLFKDEDIPVVAKPTELKLYIWPGGPNGHYNWSMARPAVTELDYTQKSVLLDRDVVYELGTGSRYFTYNALEFLDTPGEYYVDKDKGVLYYMPKNMNINNAIIVAPPAFDLINIAGSVSKPAQNIVLDGLEIRSTDLNKNTVMISNSQNIVIQNCQIYNSGNNGVYMKGSVRNTTVQNCHIYQTGFYGVFAEGDGNTQKIINYGNKVLNCHVHNVGELNGNAAGVRFANTAYCYGANMKINDSPRNALHILGQPDNNLIGKTLEGVAITEANVRDFKVSEYNTFEYNDASRCIQDSQDTNVFGAWGIDHFNVLRKNAAHDSILPKITVHEGDSFWFPFYFDENSNGSFIASNLSYDNQQENGGPMRAAFHNNASKDTTITGNIFADTQYTKGVLSINDMDGGVRRSMRIKAERNIFTGFPTAIYDFGGWNNQTKTNFDFNLFNSGSGKYLLSGKSPAKTLDEWKRDKNTNSDKNSITSDPMFVNAEQKDFRLKYNSPAYLLGFEDINQSDIGLSEDYPFADPNDTIEKVFAYREGDYLKKAWSQMDIGQTAKLMLLVRTNSGYVANAKSYTAKFASSNTAIAEVDNDGQIRVKGNGKAELAIQVSKDGKTIATTYEIIVGDSKIVSLNIIGVGKTLEVGDVVEPKVTAVSEQGRQAMTGEFYITTSRQDAVVENGMVKIGGSGELTITVTDKKDASLTGSITVQVTEAMLSKIELEIIKQTHTIGEEIKFSYKLLDSKNNEIDKTGAALSVAGDENGIVAMENGVLVAKKAGLGDITVTGVYQGVTVIAGAKVAVVPDNVQLPQGFALMNYTPKGAEPIAGYTYAEGDKMYITTSGNDAWGLEDSCTFVGKEIDGDKKTVITAKIHEVTTPHSYARTGAKAIHAAAGVMLRMENKAGSFNVFVRYRLNGDVVMSYRVKDAPATAYQKGSIPGKPVEVKLEKEGNKARGYYKTEQGEWKLIAEIDVDMNGMIYAGIASQSGVAGDFNTAVFSDLNIEQ